MFGGLGRNERGMGLYLTCPCKVETDTGCILGKECIPNMDLVYPARNDHECNARFMLQHTVPSPEFKCNLQHYVLA
jgi:hypothetical protein